MTVRTNARGALLVLAGVAALLLSGCQQSEGPVANSAPPPAASTEATTPQDPESAEPTDEATPGATPAEPDVTQVALSQTVTTPNHYKLQLVVSLAYHHAVSDTASALPERTDATLEVEHYSAQVVNATRGHDLPLNPFAFDVLLVYGKDSPLCTKKLLAVDLVHGQCAVDVAGSGFGFGGDGAVPDSLTVPVDGTLDATRTLFSTGKGSAPAATKSGTPMFRARNLPDDGRFDTYAGALDQPIGLALVQPVPDGFPSLCELGRIDALGSEPVIAQSDGVSVCA